MAYPGTTRGTGIDPVQLFRNSPGLVVRIGGNSLTPRGQSAPAYRTISGLIDLLDYCAKSGAKITIVPAGVGGHLLIEWARQSGCSDALINRIGCSLIDVGAGILADSLARSLGERGISCSPKAPTSIEELMLLRASFSVVVSGSGIRGAISSDSLSLLIADASNSPVLSVKRRIPFQHAAISAGLADCTSTIALATIEEIIADDHLIEGAGWHHSLDSWATRMLRRPGVSLSFTSAKAIKRFPQTRMLSEVMKVVKGEQYRP